MGEKSLITGTRVSASLTGRPEGPVATGARRRPCEVPSCGREVMVFPVEGPEDLPGIHPDLIGSALRPGERLRSLVYARIWDGHEAPFAVCGEPASHAVAVTGDRFLVARDPHRKRLTPSLRVIPFGDVFSVEFGSSLLVGWFVVRASDGEKEASASLLYESTYGIEHFGALVREYRAAVGPARRLLVTSPPLAWSELWRRVAPRQAGRLRPVLVEEESLVAFACSSQTWGTRSSLWGKAPVCVAEEGVLVVTDHGFVHVINEPDLRPNMWSYGINVCCIPHEALRSCAIVEQMSAGVSLRCLRLELARGRVAWQLDVPFDDTYAASATRLTRMLEGWESCEQRSHVARHV